MVLPVLSAMLVAILMDGEAFLAGFALWGVGVTVGVGVGGVVLGIVVGSFFSSSWRRRHSGVLLIWCLVCVDGVDHVCEQFLLVLGVGSLGGLLFDILREVP